MLFEHSCEGALMAAMDGVIGVEPSHCAVGDAHSRVGVRIDRFSFVKTHFVECVGVFAAESEYVRIALDCLQFFVENRNLHILKEAE